MDRAIWIAWYDLPEERRDDYLAWAHDSYIPKVLARAGVQWGAHYATEAKSKPSRMQAQGRLSHVEGGAVPAGSRYILLFGGADAHAFAQPLPRDFHAQLPAADRAMLALRAGERTGIFAEEARVDGPEVASANGGAPAPCIQLGSFNAGAGQEDDEIVAWYAQWRLPCMQKLPGCARVRKYVSVAGWARHAILYEFTSVAARNDHFVEHERPYPEQEAWTVRVVRQLVHAPGSPNLARRIWPQ